MNGGAITAIRLLDPAHPETIVLTRTITHRIENFNDILTLIHDDARIVDHGTVFISCNDGQPLREGSDFGLHLSLMVTFVSPQEAFAFKLRYG